MRDRLLIVDDVELNRDMLTTILADMYPAVEAQDGAEAIEILKKNEDDFAAILLDLMMPNVDGYGVLEYLKNAGLLSRIAVLIISAETTPEVERKCLEMGVSDFIHKPFDAVAVRSRVKNNVELFQYKNELETRVAYQTRTLKAQNKLLAEQARKARENNEKIIDVLGNIVEYRNLESGLHIHRVKGFTRILAEELAKYYPEYELTPERIDVIVAASALHDIGKIAITDTVLLKPGRLDPEEFEYMKTHTTKGCDIIDQVEGVWEGEYEKACYEICRYHHERYDGKGYPDHLVGEEIPIAAQIVSVADVYDALVSERVYKKAFSKEEAYQMILNGDCGTFSPKLMDCFRRTKLQFEQLADANAAKAG